ncbi:DNA-binding transcriptional regulator, MarR family [Halolactibacillus halophilus]|uniref:DNA-binding transcriptional regulator, MarR family n=2 Tax=Halolactibacillus halophilus TaxID=306540 RepID=A0A1I5RGW5_9BACI|nr:MarR family transcriptional regulator [Halolactibacillus halophilus]GEM02342.1 MarR family transcriptional regulator [Halolactibacillus halophilus]SFP57521.1 DNA-binding transcriptional regulator, MarR family [Halolactibacillus halophilus]
MALHDCMNFLLSVSQNKVFKYFSKLLQEYKLTPAQYGVLNCLWQAGTLSPKQIGSMLHLEAPTVSGILDRMQKADLIERSIDENSRRNVWVAPTDKANVMRESIEKVTQHLNTVVLKDVPDEEAIVLRKALKTIIASDFDEEV